MHPLDEATRLERLDRERLAARTSTLYTNINGPFGGFTAAVLTRAVMEDERRQGTPVALTVNYCAAITEGPFEIAAREVRTGKSTQHWSLELAQGDRIGATASVVCGQRREVWSHHPATSPAIPPYESVSRFDIQGRGGWVSQYEFRFAKGGIDFTPRDPADLRAPVSLLWMRDHPERPLDYVSLASMSDAFIIRAFVVRGVMTLVGTVTLTTYFHADEAALKEQGAAPLIGHADAAIFTGGFADQTAHLWGTNGKLLASSTQIVWYKE